MYSLYLWTVVPLGPEHNAAHRWSPLGSLSLFSYARQRKNTRIHSEEIGNQGFRHSFTMNSDTMAHLEAHLQTSFTSKFIIITQFNGHYNVFGFRFKQQ